MTTAMTSTEQTRLLLRREVGLFRQREARRRFDLAVYVGRLGGERGGFTVAARDLPAMDAGLRADVVGGLLADADPADSSVWITRPGTTEQHDLDLAWLAAARAAFATYGRTLGSFHALTRSGWRDVVTGETRTWVRLRL